MVHTHHYLGDCRRMFSSFTDSVQSRQAVFGNGALQIICSGCAVTLAVVKLRASYQICIRTRVHVESEITYHAILRGCHVRGNCMDNLQAL